MQAADDVAAPTEQFGHEPHLRRGAPHVEPRIPSVIVAIEKNRGSEKESWHGERSLGADEPHQILQKVLRRSFIDGLHARDRAMNHQNVEIGRDMRA
jgi:hypothetical protein